MERTELRGRFAPLTPSPEIVSNLGMITLHGLPCPKALRPVSRPLSRQSCAVASPFVPRAWPHHWFMQGPGKVNIAQLEGLNLASFSGCSWEVPCSGFVIRDLVGNLSLSLLLSEVMSYKPEELSVQLFTSSPRREMLRNTRVSQTYLCVLSHSVVSSSLRHHGLQPARLLCPRGFPGKNTGMGCP